MTEHLEFIARSLRASAILHEARILRATSAFPDTYSETARLWRLGGALPRFMNQRFCLSCQWCLTSQR